MAAERTCIIEPTAAWKGNWDLFIMFLILYSAISVPVRVCFNASAEGYLWDFEACMSLVFILYTWSQNSLLGSISEPDVLFVVVVFHCQNFLCDGVE